MALITSPDIRNVRHVIITTTCWTTKIQTYQFPVTSFHVDGKRWCIRGGAVVQCLTPLRGLRWQIQGSLLKFSSHNKDVNNTWWAIDRDSQRMSQTIRCPFEIWALSMISTSLQHNKMTNILQQSLYSWVLLMCDSPSSGLFTSYWIRELLTSGISGMFRFINSG